MPLQDAAHLRQASVVRKPHQYSLWEAVSHLITVGKKSSRTCGSLMTILSGFDGPVGLQNLAQEYTSSWVTAADPDFPPYACWDVTNYVCDTVKAKPSPERRCCIRFDFNARPLITMPFHIKVDSNVMQKFLSKITRCLERQASLLRLLLWVMIRTNTVSAFLLQNFTCNSLYCLIFLY